jgi:hypothetical protein
MNTASSDEIDRTVRASRAHGYEHDWALYELADAVKRAL